MPDALKLDITIDSVEADLALLRLQKAFRDAGDSATEAAAKVETFEKAYKDNAARTQAKKELDALSGSTEKAATSMDSLTKAVVQYVGPAVVAKAAVDTLRWADNIGEMAARTSLTTTQVQQLSKMADKNGSSFGQMAALIQASENKLASHNKKAEEAVRLMGMAPEELMKLDPLERLRAIAKGLADIEDPAQRSAAEVAILGNKADAAAPALQALAEGADKAESALGGTMVNSLARANDQFDAMINKVKDLARALIALPVVVGDSVGQMGKDSWLGQWFAAMGLHDLGLPGQSGSGMQTPGLPKSPGGGFPMPQAAGAIDPLGGNSQGFIERLLGIKKGKAPAAGPASVTPFTANQWAVIQQVLGPANPLGMGGLGSFPGWAPVEAGGSPVSFWNGVQLPGGVGMNAPGAGGGGFFSNLFGKSKTGAGAAIGVGMLSQLIPGINNAGSSIGSLVGSFLPGGPLTGALGGLAGGLIGKLFGGNKDSKEINALKSGDDFAAIKAKAEELGISMDKVFSAKKVTDFQKALKGVTDQISAQEQEQAKVTDAMERWGLSIEDMGIKFKQTQMDKTAKSFTEDFVTLVGAGADVNTVIDKMGPSINEFVNRSKDMGTTVPQEMKPIIEKMIEQGKLLDANGEKITDIGQISFAESLNAQFSSLISKLDQLLSKIYGVADGFDRASDAAGGFNREVGSGDYSGSDPGGSVAVSKGGVIAGRGNVLYFKSGGFVPRGTDTVPAMLTPGEMVISREMVRGIAKNGRAGMGGVTVNVHVAGYLDSPVSQRNIANLVTEQIRREQSMRRTG